MKMAQSLFLKVLLCEVVALLAPFVTLFYRGGWFNTPDDPFSPHGWYEPKMRRIHARFGTWLANWWWLGVRNRAYGLQYALKPAHFRQLDSYSRVRVEFRKRGRVGVTTVDGYKEYVLDLGKCHVIYGYRLTPIFNEVINNALFNARIPYRRVNMDARPIISIRAGRPD